MLDVQVRYDIEVGERAGGDEGERKALRLVMIPIALSAGSLRCCRLNTSALHGEEPLLSLSLTDHHGCSPCVFVGVGKRAVTLYPKTVR